MQKVTDDSYCKGYLAGYRQGIYDAVSKNAHDPIVEDILTYPLRTMSLSTRAINCLERAGCVSISDVAALSAETIATMRNMGAKTAAEVAHQLSNYGIGFSAWSNYL